ncbi:MAG: serine acetyltransferase [Flavobacterium sp.]|nr:serine acetyltransferase [Flavobacterium sp.]
MAKISSFLLQDAPRYRKNSKNSLRSLLFSPGLRFMFTIRGCQYFSKYSPLGAFFRIWNKNMQVKYGFQIFYTCEIGKGLFMVHYGTIVINNKSKIGENCNIHQGVTIGNVNRGKNIGCPKIGNRVWIGANAVVVGGISIGNDVLIAPLTFVNFDIPDNAVVAGNPAKIISYKGSEGYINYTVS